MIKDIQKLKYIDALRGIAVICVVFHHTKEFVSSGSNSFFNVLVDQSSIGVQLFYIVSAFTLFLSYQNRIKFEKYYIINFFIRRFFRIAPLYYLAIFFYFFWGETNETRLWLHLNEHITIYHILSNIFFVHQLNPSWINSVVPGGWSITVEMSFYLLIPLLFKYFHKIENSILLLTVSFYVMIVALKILHYHPLTTDMHLQNAFNYFILPSQLPIFCLGIIFYAISKEDLLDKRQLIIITICLAFLAFTLSKFIIPMHITLSFLVFIFCLLVQKFNPFIIVNKLFCKIGEMSFGIYLFHYAIFYLLRKAFLNFTIVETEAINYLIWLVICLIFTFLLAKLLSVVLENPFIKIGKNIIKKIETVLQPNVISH